MLTDEPVKDLDPFIFIKAFDKSSWVFVITIIFIIAAFSYTKSRIAENHPGPQTYGEWLWEVLKILMWDRTVLSPQRSSLSILLLLGVWMLMTFILVTEYTGTMTSIMTKEPYVRKPIESLEDFKESDLKWIGDRRLAVTQTLMKEADMAKRYVPAQRLPKLSTEIRLEDHIYLFNLMLQNPNTYSYPFAKLGV